MALIIRADARRPHYLVASGLVVVLGQQLGDLLHVDGVVEGSRVTDLALVGSKFALKSRKYPLKTKS